MSLFQSCAACWNLLYKGLTNFTIIYLYRIDSDDFNFCILWTSVSVLLIYVLNISGFAPELFGKLAVLDVQIQ